MTRITISLPDDMAARLTRDARRKGLSVSEVVRQALAPREPGRARRLPFASLGASGVADTSMNVDAVLAEGFGGDDRHR